MRAPKNSLFLLITVLLALTAACASSQLPEQKVEAKASDARTQKDSAVVAAIVKAKKANLRENPSASATVVSTVNKGDLLSLTGVTPIGPWYRIRDSKTGAEGWIHGDTIALLQIAETNPSRTTSAQIPQTSSPSAQRPPKVSPEIATTSPPVSSDTPPSSGRSYVNVDGIRVRSPVFSDTKPAGASARCRDGSYSFSLNRRGTCSHHGGVAEWY